MVSTSGDGISLVVCTILYTQATQAYVCMYVYVCISLVLLVSPHVTPPLYTVPLVILLMYLLVFFIFTLHVVHLFSSYCRPWWRGVRALVSTTSSSILQQYVLYYMHRPRRPVYVCICCSASPQSLYVLHSFPYCYTTDLYSDLTSYSCSSSSLFMLIQYSCQYYTLQPQQQCSV